MALTRAAVISAGALLLATRLFASEPKAREPRHFEDLTGELPSDPVTAVAVDPADDDVIYVGTDGFLFRSDDGGESWQPVLSFARGVALDEEPGDDTASDVTDADPAPAAEVPLVPLAPDSPDDPADELPDGAPDQVDVTSYARAGAGVRAVSFVPGTSTVFYVATPRGLYRTATKGGSFERLFLPGAVRGNDVRDVVVDPARPSHLYVATAAGLYVSRDGGASFLPAEGDAGHAACLCLAVGADGDVILLGTEIGLFRSFDGGDSFLEVLLRGLPPFFGVASVAVAQTSGSYYAGTADGLWVGERGAALLERYDGIPDVLVEAIAPSNVTRRGIAVGTRGHGVLFSENAGNTVDEDAEQVPAEEVLALARGKKKGDLLAGTDRGVFRSVPGTGVTVTSSALRKLRAMWAREPSLDAAAQQALAYHRLGPDLIGSMGGRAGWSHLLPSVRARWDMVYGETTVGDQFLFRGGDELPPGLDPQNDDTDLFGNVGAFLLQPAVGFRQSFAVLLTWDLDKLVLNDDEVQVGRRVPEWWAAEKRVVDRVRESWGARRRLMTELALAAPGKGAKAVKLEAQKRLRLEELTAELDAATGGTFSDHTAAEETR